jgi:hypothetical protein
VNEYVTDYLYMPDLVFNQTTTSIETNESSSGDYTNIYNVMKDDILNPLTIRQETPIKYEKLMNNSSSKIIVDILQPKIESIPNISAQSWPVKGNIDMNSHHSLPQLSLLLCNLKHLISEPSVDLGNLFDKSNEKKSLLSLNSRCLASLEFANQEEHPRSFHRVSRMEIYNRVHERLVITNLIDIDLTALLRTVWHSFS